jgi:hypothetical protein
MPSLNQSIHEDAFNVEESDDFKHFREHTMNQHVERLKPLEEQLELKRKEEEAALAMAAFDDPLQVSFKAVGDSQA